MSKITLQLFYLVVAATLTVALYYEQEKAIPTIQQQISPVNETQMRCEVKDKNIKSVYSLPTNITFNPRFQTDWFINIALQHDNRPSTDICIHLYMNVSSELLIIKLHKQCKIQEVVEQRELSVKAVIVREWTYFSLDVVNNSIILTPSQNFQHNETIEFKVRETEVKFRKDTGLFIFDFEGIDVAVGCLTDCPFKRISSHIDDGFIYGTTYPLMTMFFRTTKDFLKLRFEMNCINWFGDVVNRPVFDIVGGELENLQENWHELKISFYGTNTVEYVVDNHHSIYQVEVCNFNSFVVKIVGSCLYKLCPYYKFDPNYVKWTSSYTTIRIFMLSRMLTMTFAILFGCIITSIVCCSAYSRNYIVNAHRHPDHGMIEMAHIRHVMEF
ncbi:hypothetical protein QKT26_gp44 [Carcinus maenas nudivirus]|uniref:Uncharacterized protein n=1 Tax=Carcinus maenas nudivirus TaxID=2880837 RepID=A0AAE9BYV1_9VIRU|nr:hypothetical protein QKT26_gp44 [Carcinus maenas nudivirus]UBZ25634.1 hypothetical protein CmNV_043 [Carcinus maenas nudivirus]